MPKWHHMEFQKQPEYNMKFNLCGLGIYQCFGNIKKKLF